MTVILLLRGHERLTFKTQTLNNFVNRISKLFGDSLQIYIHTWKFSEAKTSWRTLSLERNIVTEKDIIDYFDYSKIKCIITDEEHIKLHGKSDTFIGSMPIRNWKLMWAGQYEIFELISKETFDKNAFIINMRLDYFSCNTTIKFKINENSIIQKCKSAIQNSNDITFFHNNAEFDGIDNIIFGNLFKMKNLINRFHFELDSFYEKYYFCVFHENIVYYEAQKINNTFQEPNKVEYYFNIIVNQLDIFL